MRPILKYSLLGGALGSTALSLKCNQYEWDSIGIVRFGRAALTVFEIGVIYQRDLYSKRLDKATLEYKELKVRLLLVLFYICIKWFFTGYQWGSIKVVKLLIYP